MSLEHQLADYGQHLRQALAELEVPMEPSNAVRPVPEEAPTHRSRWLIAGAAGLAAVVAVVLAVLLWPRSGDPAPFIDEGSTIPEPTTTALTTTAAVPGIVALSIPAEEAPRAFSPVAASAGEVWTIGDTEEHAGVIGRLKDGAWSYWLLEAEGAIRGLEVAPDGTAWAATDVGVFSFDGENWTRRFDGWAGAVEADEGGTVWITGGRYNDSGGLWLARRVGESWERVESRHGPEQTGWTDIAALPNGEVWITQRSIFCHTGPLMHYDGATLEAVEVTGRPFQPFPPQVGSSYAWAVEAAPNGDLWVGGFLGGNPAVHATGVEPWTEPPLLARYDGEAWTVYDWPLPNPESGHCNDPLLDIAVAPDGVVWLAYPFGLGSFDGTDWTLHIQGQLVWAVDVAPDGTVWYIDRDGLLHTLTP